MPAYRFTWPAEMNCGELRDASNRFVGLVKLGDRRFFDKDPGHMWTEVDLSAEDETGLKEHPGFGDIPMHGTEGTPDGTFTTIGGEDPGTGQDPPDETPDAPPAPETTPGA